MKRPKRLPVTVPLLPGLRWRGKLTILSREPDGYAVAFDAVIVDTSVRERFVFDRTVLTAAQLEAWTGWREG
jgi:hypothetical protein